MAGSSPFRRTAITACGVGVAVAATALTSPATAGTPATDRTAGTASAIATSYKVNPTTASLSIGIAFGISLAGYTNQVAQAESRGIDLGIIGGTLAGEGCDGGDPTLPAEDQPQPLRADSRTSGAAEQTENEKYVPLITKSVRADSTPYGEANTITAPLNGAGALIEIGATHSQAVTQLIKGNREALAVVDIASVKVAGVVELAGLHWAAATKSGATDAADGGFTIGGLKIAGQSLPTGDPQAAFDAANMVLGQLGVQLVLPRAHVEAGILFVDPLMVRVVPSAQRDTITRTILSAVQPVRKRLIDALLAQDCGNATYVTVADIVLGSVTGAGSFALELGGVQAKSEALKTTNFLGNLPPIASSSVGSDSLGGFDALDNDGGLSDVAAPPTVDLGATPGRRPALVATGDGSRGGRMALVGLLGLLALLLVADRDRRLMRRAQRAITTEA